jgi:hypothetical protein
VNVRLGVVLLLLASALAPAGAAASVRSAAPRLAAARSHARPPAVTEREVLPAIPIVQPTGPQPSFERYQLLLNDFVHVDSPKDSALRTSFNYEKFYDQPNRFAREDAIRAEFMELSPAKMDSLTRIAWAINFYNFMVIELATDHLLIPGKFRQRYVSVRDITIHGESFFQARAARIDSVTYSLDQFEKHFLFADFDHAVGARPPAGLDPRIHFALVCGARGCPPLQPRAFKPESLDYQLDRAVRAALAGPQHLTRDPKNGLFQLSSIFGWYVADFGGREKLLPWALDYAPARWRAGLKAAIPAAQFGLIPYDWSMNQTKGWLYEERMRQPLTRPAIRDTA